MTRRPIGGVPIAIAVFTIWGLFPSFFKLLAGVPPTEILAHRILWSAVFMAGLVATGGRFAALRAIAANRRTLLLLMLSASLITVNWLTYVDAVTSNHVLEASLGYFMAPLASVALGRLVLGERLTLVQTLACVIAALAVGAYALGVGWAVWRSLLLAVSFGSYGLVRKLVPAEALPGFAAECFLLLPIAGGYLLLLWLQGQAHMSLDAPVRSIELVLAGLLTSVPLIGYSTAARRLRLSTLGLLQYITPSIQFLLGVLVYAEPFDLARLLAFAAIWGALVIYSLESLRLSRGAVVTGRA
ncbi:MAG TPA: EamA family transporter RarD [Aliidongia sp.]|nr:EamA family transporter RarD [Aliidongia sp.]